MDNSKILDIIAYYLSEYDIDAVNKLGYSSRSEAFKKIGCLFGKNNNYLKRLRDEYDVVTSSHRNGQCNRPPRDRIIKTQQHLKTFSFDEISEIVIALIENNTIIDDSVIEDENILTVETENLSEEELEYIINFKDEKAAIRVSNGQNRRRVYKTSIIRQLKRLYKGKCQICGDKTFAQFGVDISEVHHVKYFSTSQNNDSINLMVLCPNHHRLIHKLNPTFDVQRQVFTFANGAVLKIVLDHHLSGSD